MTDTPKTSFAEMTREVSLLPANGNKPEQVRPGSILLQMSKDGAVVIGKGVLWLTPLIPLFIFPWTAMAGALEAYSLNAYKATIVAAVIFQGMLYVLAINSYAKGGDNILKPTSPLKIWFNILTSPITLPFLWYKNTKEKLLEKTQNVLR